MRNDLVKQLRGCDCLGVLHGMPFSAYGIWEVREPREEVAGAHEATVQYKMPGTARAGF